MKILLINYDNGSYMNYFPIGLAYIATAIREVGHEVEILDQAINHYSDEYVRDKVESDHYDFVGISMCGGYYQFQKMVKISEQINLCKNRKNFKYILGGHMSAADPDYFLKKMGADICILGESEETIKELLTHDDLSLVDGIAYRVNGIVNTNLRRHLIENIDSIGMPAYDLFDMSVYKLIRMPNCDPNDFCMPILSGRGCSFKCNFCYRLDSGHRVRSGKSILDEIRHLQEHYGITYISFGDELLMSSVNRTKELCQEFIESGLRFKWDCNGRLNFATPDVLALMKQAGCVFINYGIEAYDDVVLRTMNKALTVKQITEGIEATLEAGISPGFNIIWGNIGENEATLRKGVDFLLKYDDGAQLRTIRPVSPYPGCELFNYCVKEGLIYDTQDFYENLHINSDLFTCDIMDIGFDKAHQLLNEANRELLTNYHVKRLKKTFKGMDDLYSGKNNNFRGYR